MNSSPLRYSSRYRPQPRADVDSESFTSPSSALERSRLDSLSGRAESLNLHSPRLNHPSRFNGSARSEVKERITRMSSSSATSRFSPYSKIPKIPQISSPPPSRLESSSPTNRNRRSLRSATQITAAPGFSEVEAGRGIKSGPSARKSKKPSLKEKNSIESKNSDSSDPLARALEGLLKVGAIRSRMEDRKLRAWSIQIPQSSSPPPSRQESSLKENKTVSKNSSDPFDTFLTAFNKFQVKRVEAEERQLRLLNILRPAQDHYTSIEEWRKENLNLTDATDD